MWISSSDILSIVVVVPILRFIRDVFRFIDNDSPVGVGKSPLRIVIFHSPLRTSNRRISNLLKVYIETVVGRLEVVIIGPTGRIAMVDIGVLVVKDSIRT